MDGQRRESGWAGPAILRNNMNQYFPALSGNRINPQQQDRAVSTAHPMSLVMRIQSDALAKRLVDD